VKSLLRIIFFVGVIIQLISFSAAALNNVEEDLIDPAFPWRDAKIQVVRCLSAKKGMLMLYLKFDRALLPEEFKGRDYALVKWIAENSREVEVNEHLRGTHGILPGFGFNVKDFNLAKLMPTWPKLELEDLVRSINRMADCKKCVDIKSFALCHRRSANTTLIVMPFMTLMTLQDFIDDFGATTKLVELVEKSLGKTFDFMIQEGIVHGDLALRNVGVTFKKCGPFIDYETAFPAIDMIVLYDFGGKKTRFLDKNEEFPDNEKLEYILDKVRSKISNKLPRSSSRARSMSFTHEQQRSRESSPIKLLQNQERIIGSEHAFYGDINDRNRKRKKVAERQ
jgi:protein tyrosine kinase